MIEGSVKEYKMISSDLPDVFSTKVNDALDAGFQLYGVYSALTVGEFHRRVFSQPMVKYHPIVTMGSAAHKR